ncbi:MAG: phosphoserine phosphatase, partial [Halalkalicoccus sp.]|nr:phosphoserine phosphatase [Halalkalicoccus sp.]
MVDESKNIEVNDSDLESDSKGQLIKLAGKLRDRRNDLNQMASKRAGKRDELNAATREKVDEAQEHREKRDELNEQVQEHKQKRNELNAKANELFDEVEGRKSDLELDDGKGLEELEEEIEQLEFKQQTEVLSTEDERELIEKIENKREEYRTRQEKLEGNDDLEELVEVVHVGRQIG